ncbi:hypothetical protein Clacol_007814 [Clathrus columnatus]|uniref:Uncharacterized protein n=1 Tax=Clathrus columnatus TaxID=1419009 RepID=A0AAV5AFZ3_9AGAM|nr:hypothetical protein Clacol_007814 [Clathrus columnatus]
MKATAFSEYLKREGKPAGGGADGSMLIFPNVEPNFSASLGISDSVDALLPFLAAYPKISAAVGIFDYPGAPQLEFLLGRLNATAPAPDGLIPEPQDSVTSTLSRMADGGVFLRGTGFPELSNNTGEVELLLPTGKGVNVGEMYLQFDFSLTHDPKTACDWQGFVDEQEKMSNAFKQAMKKLAVVGEDTKDYQLLRSHPNPRSSTQDICVISILI